MISPFPSNSLSLAPNSSMVPGLLECFLAQWTAIIYQLSKQETIYFFHPYHQYPSLSRQPLPWMITAAFSAAPRAIPALHSSLSVLCKMQIRPCPSQLKIFNDFPLLRGKKMKSFHWPSRSCKFWILSKSAASSPIRLPLLAAFLPFWTFLSSSNKFCSLLPQGFGTCSTHYA